MSKCEIAVVGAGAWGTALAVSYARIGRNVVLVARDEARAALLTNQRQNARLPGVDLPSGLKIMGAAPDADIAILCSPFAHLRGQLARLPAGDGVIVLGCKGAEAGSARLGPEIVDEIMPKRICGVLTGPNFAHEVAAGWPAAAVLAMGDATMRRRVVQHLALPWLRLYGSGDVLGAALAGASKNVIAIAAGAVIGAGLGENARAGLICRGLAEIARLAVVLGGAAETVAGLAGLGDLVLTATGDASRNYRAGLALGRGARPDPACGVIEGLATAPALLRRAASVGVELPITAAVAALVAGEVTLAEAMARLLARDLKDEG